MICWIAFVLCFAASPIASADDDPLYICKPSPANAQLSVTFKPETELKDLITWTMGFQCRNVVVAADVVRHAPKVTLLAPKKLTPKQALDLFEDAVESIGLVAIIKPDTIVIKPGPTGWRGCADVANNQPLPNPYDQVSERVGKAIEQVIKIDDVTYEVPRATATVLLDDDTVAKGARIVPSMKNGQPDGLKLYAIRPSSVFGKLGLTNGDTLTAIDGKPVTDYETLQAVYKKFRATVGNLKSAPFQVIVSNGAANP